MAEMMVAWDASVYDSVEDKLRMWLEKRIGECGMSSFSRGQATALAEVLEKVNEVFREESCIKAQNEQGMRESG